MKSKLTILFAIFTTIFQAVAQTTAFTYQGRLNNSGAPASGNYDFQFILFNVNEFGFPVGPILTNSAVTVTNGLFATTLDFGPGVFAGTNLWLDISVRPSGNSAFSELLPRQPLTPTPYAVFANSASNLLGTLPATQLGEDPAFSGTVVADSFSDPNGSFIGGFGNTIETGGNGSAIGGGSGNTVEGENSYYVVIGGGAGNDIGTNNYAVTISGGIDNLILPGGQGGFIGGGQNNQISGGNFDSAIVGGQQISIGDNGDGVVIGGGVLNVIGDNGNGAFIGGGRSNTIGTNNSESSIVGGYQNQIGNGTAGYDSTASIGGGQFNIIGDNEVGASIGGGKNNTINAGLPGYESCSVIAGGHGNIIQSNTVGATILGGYFNVAGGSYSLAAGENAYATNNDTFVWGDSSALTASIANNSVTMRASGGYRFFTGSGTAGAQLLAGQTAWSVLSDRNAKKNFQPVDTVAVLDKLAAIPMEQWNYKWEKDGDVPNIGPMAQDFKHAFYPGRDDKSINTLEFDGVELAAIQGLNQKLNEKDAEIRALEKKLDELQAAVKSLAEKK